MLPTHENARRILNDPVNIIKDGESSRSLLGDRSKKSDLPYTNEANKKIHTDEIISNRPASLNLKSINTNVVDIINSCNNESMSEVDGRRRHEIEKRITIGFENITYSSQSKFSWSRGKYILRVTLRIKYQNSITINYRITMKR